MAKDGLLDDRSATSASGISSDPVDDPATAGHVLRSIVESLSQLPLLLTFDNNYAVPDTITHHVETDISGWHSYKINCSISETVQQQPSSSSKCVDAHVGDNSWIDASSMVECIVVNPEESSAQPESTVTS